MTHKKMIMTAAFVAVAGASSLATSTLVHANHGVRSEISETQKQQVTEKKAEIKERLETAKTERTEKLESKKLEVCENRQERINKLFENATERNTNHLAVFQKIEERVKAFYISKNLTAEGYDAAAANVDEKEAAAIAAIEASHDVTFDCATTDATRPGAEVKAAMQARHTALKDYRSAIKDLILVVKNHNGQNRNSTTGTTETQPTTREQ